MTRTIPSIAAVASLALLGGLGVAGPAAAEASPYCGITWGSYPVPEPGSPEGSELTDVRSGEHPCFDRLVLDLDGDVAGYDAYYAEELAGELPDIRGGMFLVVRANAPTRDDAGRTTYAPEDPLELVDVEDYRTFRQVALDDVSSDEDSTVVIVGTRARLPVRVFTLDGPGDGSRIVIDVAHQW